VGFVSSIAKFEGGTPHQWSSTFGEAVTSAGIGSDGLPGLAEDNGDKSPGQEPEQRDVTILRSLPGLVFRAGGAERWFRCLLDRKAASAEVRSGKRWLARFRQRQSRSTRIGDGERRHNFS
jgi:hypothetical protein